MVTSERLAISGYEDEPVPNELLRQADETDHLAVLLPGLGYTCDMPLFYYAETMLLDAGADVLRIEYAYRHLPGYGDLSADERLGRLFADATAAVRAGLGQRAYRRVTLVGKSLGTMAMGAILGELTDHAHEVRSVWLTPLFRDDDLRAGIRGHAGSSLVAIGTTDDHYQPTALDELRNTGAEVVVVEGADHSLDIPRDPVASVAAVGQVVAAMRTFIASG